MPFVTTPDLYQGSRENHRAIEVKNFKATPRLREGLCPLAAPRKKDLSRVRAIVGETCMTRSENVLVSTGELAQTRRFGVGHERLRITPWTQSQHGSGFKSINWYVLRGNRPHCSWYWGWKG